MRGLGAGRQLVENAIFEGKNRGMDEIEVGTEKSNLAAQRFYNKAGFNEEFVLLGLQASLRVEALRSERNANPTQAPFPEAPESNPFI